MHLDILETVIGNNRLQFFTEDELASEIEFEARERGLSDEETADAIRYALDHYDVDRARRDWITYALEAAIIAAQEAAGEHPDPSSLLRDLEVQFDADGWEYLSISGDAWDYWSEAKDAALKAAERAFTSSLPWYRER